MFLVLNYRLINSFSSIKTLFEYSKIHRKGLPLFLNESKGLFTPASLGMERFEQIKNEKMLYFKHSKENFIEKMMQICQSEDRQYTVFADDLKDMINISETEEDLKLLKLLAKMYNSTEKKNRLSEFSFGPYLMRLYYHLNAPEAAKEMFNCEELNDMFNQVTSYLVYMTLLFDKGLYEDVVRAMRTMVEMRITVNRLPRANLILTFASCYKMNSQKSLDVALEFVRMAEDFGARLDEKCVGFAAALALRQGQPHLALELCAKYRCDSYPIRNIKIESLILMERPEDAVSIVQAQLESADRATPAGAPAGYLQTTMNNLEDALKRANQNRLIDFSRAEEALKQRRLIVDRTLDSMLCQPMEVSGGGSGPTSKSSQRDRQRALIKSSINRGPGDKRNNKSRPFNRNSLSYL